MLHLVVGTCKLWNPLEKFWRISLYRKLHFRHHVLYFVNSGGKVMKTSKMAAILDAILNFEVLKDI